MPAPDDFAALHEQEAQAARRSRRLVNVGLAFLALGTLILTLAAISLAQR